VYGKHQNILNTKRDLIEQLCSELAMNFECPAKQIIGVYCAKMGITPQEWDKVAALRIERAEA
jgi:hypothetical protein